MTRGSAEPAGTAECRSRHQLVVRSAQEADVLCPVRRASQGKGTDMVELEPGPSAAKPAVLTDEGAAAAIAPPYGLLDGFGDMPALRAPALALVAMRGKQVVQVPVLIGQQSPQGQPKNAVQLAFGEAMAQQQGEAMA